MPFAISARSGAFSGLLAILAAFVAVAFVAQPADAADSPGSVYTMTNDAGGNAVVAYDRANDGILTYHDSYPTDGLGSGGNLGSQGGVMLTENGRYLLVVNAGSDDISLFSSGGRDLELLDVQPSGGDRPIGLAVRGDVVFVINDGSETVSGFRIADNALEPIAGSTQAVTDSAVQLSQVSFGPGATLIVTERSTHTIITFTLADGVPGNRQSFAAAGVAPFGFGVDREGRAVVSEAATGTLSSYQVHDDGHVTLAAGPVSTTQSAPCWVILSKDQQFAFTTNAGSATISTARIGKNGVIELVHAVAGQTNSGGQDMAVSNDGRFLYAVSRATGSITSFAIASDGSLVQIDVDAGIAVGTLFGLAAK